MQSHSHRVGIRTCSDYSPFGVELDGRTVSGGYRYGFQNQEKDDEIMGEGNSYTAEYWEYDSRLGRRWNLDPIIKEHESSFASFSNNPIWFKDPNGADTTFFQAETGTYDKKAKEEFDKAKSEVENLVSNQKELIANIRKKGIEKNWSEKKLAIKLAEPEKRLSELSKLKDDFDYIVSPSTPCITYSSDGTSLPSGTEGEATMEYNAETGEILKVKVVFKIGNSATIIHENRHTRQSFFSTTLEKEVEAFQYEQIFDFRGVSDTIEKAKIKQYTSLENAPVNYGITEMVKFLYKIQ